MAALLLALCAAACDSVSPTDRRNAANTVPTPAITYSPAATTATPGNATGAWTGKWTYQTQRYENEFMVEQIGGNQIRVEFAGAAKTELAGGKTLTDASQAGPQVVTLDTATKSLGVFIPTGADRNCRITLQFRGARLTVEQEGTCGFAPPVSAAGVYTRTSADAPVFHATPEIAASGKQPEAKAPETTAAREIRFEPGKTSTTIKGRLTSEKESLYTFNARAGQQAELKLSPGSQANDVEFSLTSPDGGDLKARVNDEWKGRLPRSGPYQIRIGARESANTDFTLTLTIR
ncbi:MAG: hypothetical protein ACKV2V_08540 [Blastocatellia bacterium]